MKDINETIVGDQPLSEEDRELVELIYSRLDTFEQSCREQHDMARKAREIIRLRDPDQDPAGTTEPTLQLQTLKSTINNVVADQMQNLPEAKLLPEFPAQQEATEDLQDLVHHIVYEVNDYPGIHRRRAEDFYATGTVVTQVAWDPDMSNGKGDIAIIRWPIEAFLWDPMADDIQNARAVYKVSWHPMSWYKSHYPDAAPYVNPEDGEHYAVGLPESQRTKHSDEEARAMLLEYWYREYNAKKHQYTINVAYCAGGALLTQKKNVYKHGMYPFVIDVYSPVEGSMVGDGMVSDLVPMMRYINRYAKYIDTNLRMSSKGRILTRRNSGIDREALADWSQDIVEGDSVIQGQDWNWMQHAPFNGMISNQMLQFQSDLKQDAGANQFTRGETTGGIVSGKAIAALQSAGGKVQQMRVQLLNAGFKLIVEQVLWLMSEFYTADRILLVTGKDLVQREVTMDAARFFGNTGKAVNPPPYTVQVEISTRDPIRIESMNETYMQAFTMAAQSQQFFPLSALFEILNIDGKDRLLPIIRANEQHQQQMQQMQQQVEEMTGQLQQLEQENRSLKATTSQVTSALAKMGASGAIGRNQPQAQQLVQQARMQNIPPQLLEPNYEE